MFSCRFKTTAITEGRVSTGKIGIAVTVLLDLQAQTAELVSLFVSQFISVFPIICIYSGICWFAMIKVSF